MDRDQQSRRKKAGAASHAVYRPKRQPAQQPRQAVPPKRGLGSRLGIEKPAAPTSRRRAEQSRQPAARQAQNPPRRQAKDARRPAQQPAGNGGTQQPRRQPAPQPPHSTRYRRTSSAGSHPAPDSRNPQSARYRPGAVKHQRRVTQVERLRIRRRRKVVGVICILAALAVGVILSINLLFKVADFRVENMDRTTPANTGIYTEEQIIDLLGVQVGDNLFGFSTSKKSQELQEQLPYLDEIRVDVQMPSTVVIKVRPATERFAIERANDWLILSDSLKVLRTDSGKPDGLIQLDAAYDTSQPLTPGSHLALVDAVSPATAESAFVDRTEEQKKAQTPESAAASRAATVLADLMDSLDQYGMLGDVTLVSVRDLEDINFLYQGRVSVILGTANNLDYKMQITAKVVLDQDGNGLSTTDRGTLDVSYQRNDGTIAGYFAPEQPAPTPTPAPTPDPSASPVPDAAADPDQTAPTPTPVPQDGT